MNRTPSTPQLFLLGQELRELVGVDDPDQRRFHVCGGVSPDRREARERPDTDPWVRIERNTLTEQAAGRIPWKRVALVCDAGLGKTTNLEWLAAAMTRERGYRQIPCLLRLDTPHDLNLLVKEHTHPNTLLKRLAALVKKAAGGETHRHRQALVRMQSYGRITLLIDGLDHALSRPDVPLILAEVLTSSQWRDCPVWVSGRPYAFDNAWSLFADPEWHFLRVEPLGEAEVRFYLRRQAGGDWYDEIAAEGRGLLAVPRLLRLTADILNGAVQGAAARGEDGGSAVRRLGLSTAADVYDRAYFTPGEWIDPQDRVPGQRDHAQGCGLIAAGLRGKAARIGLARGGKPSRTNYRERIDRTAAMLGAIAFEMFATNADMRHPEPNVVGVPEEQLGKFKTAVAGRLRAAGARRELSFSDDFERLNRMNNKAVDFLLFRELGEKGLVWHDRTVQAFFAAYWAMRFSAPEDRQLLKRWVVDAEGKPLDGFHDFWTFAAEMPDALLDEEKQRWLEVFTPCYAPPQEVKGGHEWVQWHRRMIYYSFSGMQRRSPKTVEQWRSSFHALAKGTAKQKRLYQEIEGGFKRIPNGMAEPRLRTFPMDRSGDVAPFRMHQWQVTNEMYEQFDPEHCEERWANEGNRRANFSLGKKRQNTGDRCPVVHVTWYDAWCFATWCGHRLPMDVEWTRAASDLQLWSRFTDVYHARAVLAQVAWHAENSDESTHAVGQLNQNEHGLFDMYGNVWEWCGDLVVAIEPAWARVLRGGCWDSPLESFLSSDARLLGGADYSDHAVGFRLAADPGEVGGK